jgi:hypothetical protein
VYWPFQKTFKILRTFWTAIVLLAFVLILLPVAVVRRGPASLRPMLRVLPYFFLVGACFMLLEMELIHHFVIFVGSPGASMAVVLASMLVSCGAGSYAGGLIGWKPPTKILAAACILLAAALLLFLLSKPLFAVVWGWGWNRALRCIVAGLMIAPMGLAMGWFFPSGLEALARTFPDSRLIPWAVSINGFASVVGSAAVLPLSMLWGFHNMLAAACAGYLAASLLSLAFFSKR